MAKWILLTAFALVMGCGTPYKNLAYSYAVLNQTRDVAEGFDRSFKAFGLAEHERCARAHGVKTPAYATCIDPAYSFLVAWTGQRNGVDTGKGILPAIQTTQSAARRTMDGTYDYIKGHESECKKKTPPPDCKYDLMLLKPVGCALIEVADRAVKLGAISVTENEYYKLALAFGNWALGCGR